MGIFDRFENVVEKGVNSVFSKMFRSGLQPVDISSALQRVMDDTGEKEARDEDLAVVPNNFVVVVASSDWGSLEEVGIEKLTDDLRDELVAYADEQDYVLAGPVKIRFDKDKDQLTGTLEVHADIKRGTVAPATGSAPSPDHPIIDVDGEKWLLTEDVTVIGRSSKADITINDAGVSRKHAEFRITPDGVVLTDLGSTNGTFVEGHRVEAATLLDGNQITVGRTRILFWTHPK